MIMGLFNKEKKVEGDVIMNPTSEEVNTNNSLEQDIMTAYLTTLYSGINPQFDTVMEINPNVDNLYPVFLMNTYRVEKIPGYMSVSNNNDTINILEQTLGFNTHSYISNYDNISTELNLSKLVDWIQYNGTTNDICNINEMVNYTVNTAQKGCIFILPHDSYDRIELVKLFESNNFRYTITTSFSDNIFVATIFKGNV